MRECEHKQPLCDCVDWKTDDLAVRIDHIMRNFEFAGFELEYAALETEGNRRLCKIGRCRTCGKRLCIGTRLTAQDTADGLLAEIFRWTLQMWNAADEKLPDGAECFTDMFLSLFHESDREFVREWVDHHAENGCSRAGEDL